MEQEARSPDLFPDDDGEMDTPATYWTAATEIEGSDSEDDHYVPDTPVAATAKKRPAIPHPDNDKRIYRTIPVRRSEAFTDNTNCPERSKSVPASRTVRFNAKPTRLQLSDSSSDDNEYRTAADQQALIPATRQMTRTKKKKAPEQGVVTDSDSDEPGHVRVGKPRHILKPPKYDGSTPFETFWAQFRNCAGYNKWNKTEELAYLRGALEKEAGQVLWDYGPEVTDSLRRLTGILKDRFGGANMEDRYRMELKNKRRKPGETIRGLHSDIRRLIALAFPGLDQYHREKIACDYFIDALADPDFALKVRERAPENLDDALRIALQLEIWIKDVERASPPDNRKPELPVKAEKRVREAGKDFTGQPLKRIEEIETRMQQQSSIPAGIAVTQPHLPPVTSSYATSATPDTARQNWKDTTQCFGCGLTGHIKKDCPNRGPGGKQKNDGTLASRPIHAEGSRTFITVKYKHFRIHALCDTGSDVTLVNRTAAKRYKWTVEPCEKQSIAACNGEKLLIDGVVRVRLNCSGKEVVTTLYVSPDISGVILGIDWLTKPGNVWDFGEKKIKIGDGEWIPLSTHSGKNCSRIYADEDVVLPPRQETTVNARMTWYQPRDTPVMRMNETVKIPGLARVYVARSLLPARHTDLKVRVLNADSKEQTIKKGTGLGSTTSVTPQDVLPAKEEDSSGTAAPVKTPNEKDVVAELMDSLPDELAGQQRSSVRDLIRKHEAIFSKHEYDIGRTPLVEYRIDTGDHRPIRQPLRRHPFQQLEAIDRQVEEMRQHDIIEPAASPWASNVVLVKKKDGSLRFCVDYRRIDAITYKDSYPLPHIDNCLNALSGSSWFSTLDLRSGYYNIPIAEQDRDKSAFVTRRGCYRYTVMPFGMTCAPSVFQRLMDCVLSGLSYITCLVYLDDIIIFSRTFDEHITRLDEVFERIRKANLKLKTSKCSLCQRQVEFLGHIVSGSGIAMQPEKIKAIRTWPECRSVPDVRAFLGTCGYYRRFIKDFSLIAAPLYDVLKKNTQFEWTEERRQAFEVLKERLMTEPVLALPTDTGQYVLDTDASNCGLGAVLSEKSPDGDERVIAYASRTLRPPELKYETTRKELLAVVYGLKQYRQYLHGRHIVIRTDHAALSWLRHTPDPMPQLARWLTFIEEFDYEVQHREGRKHGNADGLSRRPDPDISDECAIECITGSVPDEATVLVREGASQTGELPDDVPDIENVASSAWTDLAKWQKEDPELGPIARLRVNEETQPVFAAIQAESEFTKRLWNRWDQLEVRNGLLYRRYISNSRKEEYLQLLIPRRCVKNVLHNTHTGMTGGHYGSAKTLYQVKRRYHWNTWRSDTVRYCRRCPECCEYHRGKLPRQGPLQPVLAGAPMERLYVDITGPHPLTDRKHQYILTCVDGFTKHAEAFAIRHHDAETIARILVEQVFCRYGTPLSLLTDQGKDVDGKLMKAVCDMLGIEKLRTTPYKPSTDQVERLHRTLNAILGKTVAAHQRDWDLRLSSAMAAYRASRHDATGYSPNMLMMGRETRMPVDIVYPVPDELATTYDDYAGKLQEKLTTAYEEVRQELRKAAERNKRHYDVTVKPHRYAAGNWVYYYNPRKHAGRQDKWERKFTGPYLVIATPSPVNVTLQRSSRAKPFTVHIDKVKTYAGDPPRSWLKTIDPAQTCDAGTQASEREFSYPEAMDDSPDSDQTEVKTLEQPVPDNIKRLWNRWDQLEVSNGLLYRRYISNSRKEEYLQLLIPRRCVENVLYNTHTGRTGGHYGSAKTLYQAKRRFHWNTWRSDTVRCCRRCPECCEYCYGTLRYVRPICRVTDMI